MKSFISQSCNNILLKFKIRKFCGKNTISLPKETQFTYKLTLLKNNKCYEKITDKYCHTFKLHCNLLQPYKFELSYLLPGANKPCVYTLYCCKQHENL
jgi:hypothetical protein